MDPDSEKTPLTGHVVVFAGRLWSLSRREAQAAVCRLGGACSDEVSGKTTLVIASAERGSRAPRADAHEHPQVARARAINVRDPGRIHILSEDEFCALAGLPRPSALCARLYPVRDVLAMYPALREEHLRYLARTGLVRPALRTSAGNFFSFADLSTLRQVNAGLLRGLALRAVVRALEPEREGQMGFDFQAEAEPARVLDMRPRARMSSLPAEDEARADVDRAGAERSFAVASALDNGEPDDRAAAARAYRQALEADPYLIPALINLGNLHYAEDELVEAQALYERALRLAPDVHEAHFNLGNVHHDLGRFEMASECYREAIALQPNYAEAHFYLAVTLEKLGRSQEAKPHWKAYRRLAPDGEWIDLAREFSE